MNRFNPAPDASPSRCNTGEVYHGQVSAGAPAPSASALRKVGYQIRHRLSDMELRSNVSAFSAPSPVDKTSGYVISEVADWQLRQWLHIIENAASAIEAQRAETAQTGSVVDESAGPQDDAQPSPDTP